VDYAQGVANVAQALAILVGGFWAYFKFFRGRTFARRAEVSLAPSIVRSSATKFLKVVVTVTNTGASKIAFEPGLSVVYVYAVTSVAVAPGASTIEWGKHLSVTRILTEHGWIEAQEVITDEVLIPLTADYESAGGGTSAYNIVCKVLAKRSSWRRVKTLQWTANAVMPVEDEEEGT
jgi:hypothetical protein